MTLGDSIKKIRGDKSAIEFSYILGIKSHDLIQYELNTKKPDILTMTKIADYAGITLNDLVRPGNWLFKSGENITLWNEIVDRQRKDIARARKQTEQKEIRGRHR